MQYLIPGKSNYEMIFQTICSPAAGTRTQKREEMKSEDFQTRIQIKEKAKLILKEWRFGEPGVATTKVKDAKSLIKKTQGYKEDKEKNSPLQATQGN